MRASRGSAVVWVLGGSALMYVVAISLHDEMTRFAGGPVAMAKSLRAGVEGLRFMRWPADRLDTMGGYLWYHNITLVNLFLCIYAATHGARAVRGDEDDHSLEEVLATGWSRAAVIRDRAAGFFVTVTLIALGIGLGVAASLAAVGHPDLSGSLLTLLASALAAMVAYALGLLVSQVTTTGRAAAGVSAIVLTALYIATNIASEVGPFGVVRFLSPFHYANASRAIVPGFGFDVGASAILVGLAAVLLGLAAWAFERRDYRSSLWVRTPRPRAAGRARVQRPMLRSVWTATLYRGRLGLLSWCLAAAAYLSVFGALQPSVMDAWSAFKQFAGIAGGGPGISPATQYMSLAAEIVTPIVAAFVVTQAGAWVADLAQGRTEVMLATPVSWSRLVWERILAATIGAGAVAVVALGGLAVAATIVGAPLHLGGLVRTVIGCVLLGAALAGVAAVIVTIFRTAAAVRALAVFVGASYLLGLLVPILAWPDWVNRLSLFGAFGHPYLRWPPVTGTVVLLVLALGGGLLGAATAERTPKVA